MKKLAILIAFLSAMAGGMAQSQDLPLGENAFASVIVCEPGNDFYTTFGHAAIRICDPGQNIDVVYNYGTFDFNTKNFYLKFAMGRLDYCLSRANFGHYLEDYIIERRAVWEQRLDLTNQEVNNLFLALEWNYLPANRYYRYDFFRDNCATRVRDMINNSLIHRTLFTPTTPADALSYRELINSLMDRKLEWWRFGTDLLLGTRCDRPCNSDEYMFLPKELLVQLDTTTVSNTGKPLVAQKNKICSDTRPELSDSVSPTIVFWFIFVATLCVTVIGWAKRWRLQWMDAILFGAAALISLFLIFMWFASAHYCTKLNLNLFWASPLFIYFAIAIRRSNRWIVVTQLVLLVTTLIIMLIGWPQHFNAAVCPIALTLIIRLISQIKTAH